MDWYGGWTLKNKKLGNMKGTTALEALEAQIAHFGAKRNLDTQFVMPICAVTEQGVCGKVEQGSLILKDSSCTLNIASQGGAHSQVSVGNLSRSGCAMEKVGHGDYIMVGISDTTGLHVGDVLYGNGMELKPCQTITALVA